MADGGELPTRRVGAGVAYSPELAWAICQRVAAGESLMAVCREAGMPHRTTVRLWAHGRAPFGQALAAAQKARRLVLRRRDRGREAERRALPVPARGGRPSEYTPQVGEEICWRLMHGQSVLAIARDPAMPCAGTVYRWVQRHDDFYEMYHEARVIQADYLFDETREVALEVTADSVSADRLRFDITRWQTSRLAPKKYVERVVWLHEKREVDAEAEAAAREAQAAPRIHYKITKFERSPDGKTVLAVPPRNEKEEAAWEAAYGERYSGPRY